jgi:hypothetical protein
METNTGLVILGTAIGSAKVVEKILGPTADYIGGGLKNWTERRVHNVGRIFEKARNFLGDKINDEGSVPPKVLKGILDEGSFCEDELAAEYFGGVLASSRSEISRDDRGAAFVSLISRLTTYQIRAHCFFYNIVKLIFDGHSINLLTSEGRRELETYIPVGSWVAAMEFSDKEDVGSILNHVMFGLVREGLIEQNFRFGPANEMKRFVGELASAGILFQPSALGVELFHWAYGKGNVSTSKFLDPTTTFTSNVKIKTLPGFKSTKKKEEASAGDDA